MSRLAAFSFNQSAGPARMALMQAAYAFCRTEHFAPEEMLQLKLPDQPDVYVQRWEVVAEEMRLQSLRTACLAKGNTLTWELNNG